MVLNKPGLVDTTSTAIEENQLPPCARQCAYTLARPLVFRHAVYRQKGNFSLARHRTGVDLDTSEDGTSAAPGLSQYLRKPDLCASPSPAPRTNGRASLDGILDLTNDVLVYLVPAIGPPLAPTLS